MWAVPVTDPDLKLYDILDKTCRDTRGWQLDLLGQGLGQGICQVMFLNAHGVNLAAREAGFRDLLAGSDHLLRDGIGVELGLKALGLPATENLNGTDLIPRILERHKDSRIAIWGSSEATLDHLGRRLAGEGYKHLVSFEHGFHDDAFYVEKFRALRPDIVVLCMGMPRQERLSAQLAAQGGAGLIISAGGWANFYSGQARRAPLWVRRLKLEWLHRLAREPLRLGRRYTVDIVAYLLVVRRIARKRRARPQA